MKTPITPALLGDPEDTLIAEPVGDVPPVADPGAWEPIDSAPHGPDIWVRWGATDEAGRVVRWHNGRRLARGRWVPGGRWSPTDDLTRPLPIEQPSEWFKPPGFDTQAAGEEEAAA